MALCFARARITSCEDVIWLRPHDPLAIRGMQLPLLSGKQAAKCILFSARLPVHKTKKKKKCRFLTVLPHLLFSLFSGVRRVYAGNSLSEELDMLYKNVFFFPFRVNCYYLIFFFFFIVLLLALFFFFFTANADTHILFIDLHRSLSMQSHGNLSRATEPR